MKVPKPDIPYHILDVGYFWLSGIIGSVRGEKRNGRAWNDSAHQRLDTDISKKHPDLVVRDQTAGTCPIRAWSRLLDSPLTSSSMIGVCKGRVDWYARRTLATSRDTARVMLWCRRPNNKTTCLYRQRILLEVVVGFYFIVLGRLFRSFVWSKQRTDALPDGRRSGM